MDFNSFENLKNMFISIINSYNSLFSNMNILNKNFANESKGDMIKLDKIKEPIDLINKELLNSKSLLENFYIKFSENIRNIKNSVN